MSTYSEFSTEEGVGAITEYELEDEFENEPMENNADATGVIYVMPISMVEDIAMMVFIFALGMLLNSIILRCYWKAKGATSTYYRGFAICDMGFLVMMLIRRGYKIVWPTNTNVILFLGVTHNVTGGLYNFGPMFLAMDRCLIVAFPHNFREKEGKLRVAKVCMILLMAILALKKSLFLQMADPNSAVVSAIALLASVATVAQILAIIGLYTTVVVKVLMSDRKMKSSRHFGNK